MASKSMFNRSSDLKLIELVRDNPILYNPTHPKYSDSDVREQTWIKIGETIQKPARRCKLRWMSMRDLMRKRMRDRVRFPEQRFKNYRYEAELAFVIPYYKESNSSNEYTDLLEDSTEVEMPSEVYIDESLNMNDDDVDFKPILTFRECKTAPKNHSNSGLCQELKTSNPVDIFLMTIRSTLRKFSPYYLNQAKSKIFETVQDYELKQIENRDH